MTNEINNAKNQADGYLSGRVYLDYAASAPLFPESKKTIEKFLETFQVGNPSSLHAEGRKAQALLDKAHTSIAAIFGVQPTEIVFTSGASESNNLAIRGVLQAWRQQNKTKPHVIMSAIEHPSWRSIVKSEDAEITMVPVSKEGVVAVEAVLEALQENTALVGCLYVNNEIGTIQPIEAIGKGIEGWRKHKKTTWPIFHVDAVQAFPYLNTHEGHMHADMVTFSGHKYGALGGIGVLIIKKQAPFVSLAKGGGQEWGYRAGTENVLGALTLESALLWHDANREMVMSHAKELQETLEGQISQELPRVAVLGQSVLRGPHITYLWLPDVFDEHVVHQLDLAGIAISSGSACSSGAMVPSSTLVAMGYSDKEAFGGIRVSYGRFTTKEEIKAFVSMLKRLIK